MARKTITDMSAWPSLSLEGNLIAPAMVAQIAEPKDDADTRAGYGIRKGLTIREEMSTAFRVGQSHFDAFAKLQNPSVEATRRFVRGFLKETFGFEDLVPADGAVSFLAGGRVPIVVVPPADEKLDRRSATLSTDRSRSPAFALQDYLNDNDDALWGLVTNGVLIRLMRDNASLTRPAYIEADLAQIFANEDAASFSILWLMIHRSRFGQTGAPATDCALEHWRDSGSREGEAARERLADQVELALKCLGSGFLDANPELAGKLKSGEINLTEWFNELLRLVYRLIFLMVAEDRNLLHPEKAKAEARKLYAEGYSLAVLRTQCFRAATWDKHFDRFEGVKILFKALAHGEERLALPALGGLFAEGRLPHLESAILRNKAFMEALYRLSWLSDKAGMVPVNWRAMETEELGSVYESLLELQPQLGDDGKTLNFASEAAEQKGNQRKTSGSYYTPDSLVQALLDTALDPVLDKTEAEADDPEKALLKLSVIDPACGSGHFLLAAARRIATRVARIRADGTPSLADFRHALRDVARSCLHGVDRNPMAVELTKVALWIETVDPGLPLGFFDAQIRCGDALLGVFDLKVLQDGIPDAAYKPLTGDDKDTAKYYLQANRDAKKGQGGFDFGTGQVAMPEMKPLAVDFSGFRDLPEDTVEQIGVKAARFKELRKGQAFVRATAGANLYVAAFLLPKVGGAPAGASARTVPTTEELWLALNQGKIRQAMMDAPKAARRARAFHWPLEFPDVMQRGGFDVVLGNPPWERIKLQEQEFFAAKSPAIAAASNKSARQKLIRALETASAGTPERAVFDEYVSAKREAEASSEFIRIPESQGSRFDLSAKGDVNTYSLFSELGISLSSPRGRCGIIVPSGLATDSTTKDLFGYLVESRRLISFLEFENEGFFLGAGQGHMLRFALTTISGRNDPLGANERTVFLFQGKRVSDLLDNKRVFYLSAEEIVLFSPNSRTMPIFQSSFDAEIFGKIYRKVPVLVRDSAASGSAAPDPWGMRLSNMFHMSNDSDQFRLYGDVGILPSLGLPNSFGDNATSYWPLYEAKMMNAYNHRYGDFSDSGHQRSHILPEVGLERLEDPNFEPMPYYWISKELIDAWARHVGWNHKWYLGWRNITDSRASARTVVASVLPESGVGNSINIMMPDFQTHGPRVAGLIGNLSALVLDFIARKKVGGLNLNFFTMKQFAFLPPEFYTEPRLAFITPKVLELTYTSHSLAPFARDLGHDGPPFAWDEGRRAHLRADLDAFYARAYCLSRDELRYILDPADVKGPDYPSETFRVLKEKEMRAYGEYRTRRLVLAAWDRMEENGEFSAIGM